MRRIGSTSLFHQIATFESRTGSYRPTRRMPSLKASSEAGGSTRARGADPAGSASRGESRAEERELPAEPATAVGGLEAQMAVDS